MERGKPRVERRARSLCSDIDTDRAARGHTRAFSCSPVRCPLRACLGRMGESVRNECGAAWKPMSMLISLSRVHADRGGSSGADCAYLERSVWDL